MKKKYIWTCDYCGDAFDSKNDCDKHELSCSEKPKGNVTDYSTDKPLVIWLFCLIIFFASLYVGGVKNGTFVENPSLIKNIAFVSLLGSFVIGILSFILLLYRIVKQSVSSSKRIKKLNSSAIFGWTSLLIFLYFLTYFVANSYAKNTKDLLQPLKWFSPEVEKVLTPTPTPTQEITPTSRPTLIPKKIIKPTTIPVDTDPIINCTMNVNCGGDVRKIKKSECSNGTCCQIGSSWIFYTSRQKCTEDQNKYNSNYTYPTYAPYPTYKPIPTSSYVVPTVYATPTMSQEQAQLIINQHNDQVRQCQRDVASNYSDPIIQNKCNYGDSSATEMCLYAYQKQRLSLYNNCGQLY